MSVHAADLPDPDALRQEIAAGRLATGDVERHFRRIQALDLPADLRVAWLANHTLEPVQRHASVLAFAHGVQLASHMGAFGQHFQALLDPASPLHAWRPDAIVLSLSARTLAPALAAGGAALAPAARQAEAGRVLDEVRRWVDAARERTPATLLVCNFPRPALSGRGLADLHSEAGDAAVYGELNAALAETFRRDPQVHVLDADAALANAGRVASFSPALYHLARIEWHGPGVAAAAELLARALVALGRPPKKCLLLDLDNTLWGGVVGEDGVDGLRVAPGDAVGEAFREFQRALLDLKARGVLLGIVSKNNPEDVEEAFRRLEMPLSLDDFAAVRVNWEHKHVNVEGIARELGLGLDSIAFTDDSPAECELVRRMLPEVAVIALPQDPAAYVDAVLGSWHFDKLVLTEEDSGKTAQYRANAARARQRERVPDLGEWLESLGTRVEIGRAGDAELARLHQLFGKTNQFNLTTRRYTPAELRQFAHADEWLFEWLRVRDNFGDLGIVGTWLVRLDAPEPEIDSFLLSCRALGRGVEIAACNHIKQRVFAGGAEALRARFVPTRRNRPAAGFYESQGFSRVRCEPDGSTLYRLAAAHAEPLPCTLAGITTNGEG